MLSEYVSRSWLWRRVEQQSTDLQRERELLSVVVTRGNVHRFDLQRERVFFHFVKEPRERRHAAERINATFQRHIVVRIPSPLRLAGTDADPALVRPAINRLEHLAFGRRQIVRQRVRSHPVPPTADRLLPLQQRRALVHVLFQFGDALGPRLPMVLERRENQAVGGQQRDGRNGGDGQSLLAVLYFHCPFLQSNEN